MNDKPPKLYMDARRGYNFTVKTQNSVYPDDAEQGMYVYFSVKDVILLIRQKFYRMEDAGDLAPALSHVSHLAEYETASGVLVMLGTQGMKPAEAEKVRNQVKDALPKAVVVGMSMIDILGDGSFSPAIYMRVTTFETSVVEAVEYGKDTDFSSIGCEAGEMIHAREDIKAVGIIYAGCGVALSKFIGDVSRGNEKIPFFGIVSNLTDIDYDSLTCRNAFDEMDLWHDVRYTMGPSVVMGDGMVMLLYSGDELFVKADYLFGWTPLGREFTFTEVERGHIARRIDDMPAGDIYLEYLGVQPDDYFVMNVCEFPLVIMRDGAEIPRVPPVAGDDGTLYFLSDIRQGERLRISYGNPSTIFWKTWELSEELREFSAESVFLVSCGNRSVFLKDQYPMEAGMFRRYLPNAESIIAQSEIFRYEGKGGLLNSSLVVCGMREGKGRVIPPTACPVEASLQAAGSHVIPLAERLATFIERGSADVERYMKKAEEAAKAANAANLAKSQFLSNMSHEIRTPINAILGMNEMILRESTEEAVMGYAENVKNAGSSLLGIVNDILDFSKIEAGKMEIIPVEYELASVLNDLVNMIRTRAEKKSLALHVEASPDLPSLLYGDEIRIKQVVTNILTNAVKYTEKGSVTLAVSFSKLDGENISLRFGVRDTGIGIKGEDMKKLYSAFDRIEEKRNRTVEGTGLGMNITKRLLELMGSSLDVVSVYGEGSTFSFAVTQRVVKWDAIGHFEDTYRRSVAYHRASHEAFTAPDAKILVVDDTEMNLTVMKSLLKRTKVKVTTALSGAECLDLAAKNHYDIIFLDHRMPGMDGMETLTKLRAMKGIPNEDTPVISLTANAISGAREEYLRHGFNDYLTKPVASDKLEAMMVKYLPLNLVHLASCEICENLSAASSPGGESLPEWLIGTRGLDTERGLINSGSLSGYLDALTIFYESIADGASEIEGYLASGDIKNYTTKVHALKSSAKIIGADELSERARRLEDAGLHGYTSEIEKDTPELLSLYRSYLEKLSPLKKEEKTEKPEISPEELREAYETIREMASSFDFDSIEFVIASLDEYSMPEEEAARYEKIREAATKPDWEELKNLINRVQ